MGRIQTEFGFFSAADAVIQGIDLSGKRAVVTGASSGIGVETARALAAAGADVTLAVRNIDAGSRTASDIAATTGNRRVHVEHLDLIDRVSIDRFVQAWCGALHILVNNAGGVLPTLHRTPEGWEQQFAQNHLGHFALALGLHGALKAAGGARIVSVSSSGHLFSPIVFDDLQFNYRPYDALLAYGQSKTANILFAVGATRRWAKDGITANAVMPGPVASNFVRNIDEAMAERLAKEFRVDGKTPVFKTPTQGAATSVFAATAPLLSGIGGRYFEDCNEAEGVRNGNGYGSGMAPYALDISNAERLWDVSMQLVGTASRHKAANSIRL
jgi:NAD(P)-dependent dehydrogenase (short-subunit alcohol dehydrogenase family)